MITLTERLEGYMAYKGLNNNKLTVQAKLSVGLLGKAMRSNKGLNSDTIEKILNTCPDLNPEWLLTGNGPMLKSVHKSDPIEEETSKETMNPYNDHDLTDQEEIPQEQNNQSNMENSEKRSTRDVFLAYCSILEERPELQSNLNVLNQATRLLERLSDLFREYMSLSDSNLTEMFEYKKIDYKEFERRVVEELSAEEELGILISPYIDILNELECKVLEFDKSRQNYSEI